MNPYISIPLLIVLSLLQPPAAPRLSVGSVWPDFVLLVVMSWALLRRPEEALGWAFVGGISLDLLSGGPFGASALGLMLVAWIAGYTATGVFRGRTALPILTAFGGTLAFHFVYLVAMLLIGQPVDALDALFRLALPAAVYNGLLSVLVFRLMAAVDHRIRPKALRW